MIQQTSDVPRGDADAIAAEEAAIRAYLSAVADEDDDPETNADDVRIDYENHPDNPDLIRIIGTLDAEANAPYLRPDYDPYANVDPELFAAEIEAAQRDEAVLRGKA